VESFSGAAGEANAHAFGGVVASIRSRKPAYGPTRSFSGILKYGGLERVQMIIQRRVFQAKPGKRQMWWLK
jgi:hypothetical protein